MPVASNPAGGSAASSTAWAGPTAALRDSWSASTDVPGAGST